MKEGGGEEGRKGHAAVPTLGVGSRRRKALSSPVGTPVRGWVGLLRLAQTAPAAWERALQG